MANYSVLLLLVGLAFAAAKPIPDYEEGGQEVLKGADTRYYGLPLFWYQRPLRDNDGDDYGIGDGGYERPVRRHRDKKVPIYESVGAGWGR